MDNTPLLMYSFLNAIHYENIERYVPTSEYYEVARQILPQGWTIKQRAFWTMCTPPGWVGIKHGWKIHVSSQVKNAAETLSIVATLLQKEGVAFKFCSDPRMLRMSTRKTWSRFQVGKAITVYPADEQQFKSIIEQLHHATRHLIGPHILTDRAYRQSRHLLSLWRPCQGPANRPPGEHDRWFYLGRWNLVRRRSRRPISLASRLR